MLFDVIKIFRYYFYFIEFYKFENCSNEKSKNFNRNSCFLVGAPGFEPGTPCSQSRYANRTALRPEICLQLSEKSCGERGIRTLGTVTRTSV